jgi:hypothetical protein
MYIEDNGTDAAKEYTESSTSLKISGKLPHSLDLHLSECGIHPGIPGLAVK